MSVRVNERTAARRLGVEHIPSTTVLGKIARIPLRLIPRRSVLPILTGPLKGRRWIVASGVHGYWLGTYEAALQHAITRCVKPGGVFFDIGAHAGYHTLLASRLVGPHGRVLACEPDARNLAYLRHHLRLNGVRNVTVVAAAAAGRAGTALFAAERSGFSGALSPAGTVRVATVTLDDLVRDGTIPPPSCLKIDVEGAELRVLRGAVRILRKHRPTLFLAVHSAEAERRCRKMLAAFGYALEPITRDAWLCTAAPA